jgi:hypothetical protein
MVTGVFPASSDNAQKSERTFPNTDVKMDITPKSEKTQNVQGAIGGFEDKISLSNDAQQRMTLIKTNETEEPVDQNLKLPSTQKEQFRSSLSVMA